jgi:hypothetical protein
MDVQSLRAGAEAIGVNGGMSAWFGWRALFACGVAAGLWLAPALAAGPVETSIFAVQGVDVDITAKDAAAAKDQALMDVQVKAFFQLVAKLGSPELADKLKDMKPEEIAPFLKSLSVEKESSAPGRYIGTFTVRFLSDKMQKFLGGYGVSVPTQQASPVIILPVWKAPEGPQLWEDNPWRQAWLDLHAEQAMVPLIVPLGDLEDSGAISAQDALNNDVVKVEAIRRRYDAPGILIATAEPVDGGGVHVTISGETRLGKVQFDKVYTGEDGSQAGAIAAALTRFTGAMTTKYRQDVAKANQTAVAANKPHAITVAIPFASPTEWNGIRSRILATPKVLGVDVSSLSGDGATIRLIVTAAEDELQANLRSAGLAMTQIGGTWVIQPL